MKIKRLFLLLFAVLFSGALLPAQTEQTVIPNVRRGEFRGVRSINETGYYASYIDESLGRGMVNMVLEIYDIDMTLVKRVNTPIDRFAVFQGSEFNGQAFIFSFVFNKEITFVTFDTQGQQLGKLVQKSRTFTGANATIFPHDDGSGFFVVHPIKEKKWGYIIEKYDNKLNKVWEKLTVNDKGIVSVLSARSTAKQLVTIQSARPSLMSTKMLNEIVSIDPATGAERYSFNLFTGDVTLTPTAFLIEEDGSVVTGGMYFNGERADAQNSDGVFLLKLDPSGKQQFLNLTDWEAGIQEVLNKTRRKFVVGSKVKVIFHEIVHSGDGGYQVIGETFRKSIDGLTVASAMMNNGDTPVKFSVMDFIVFNYDGTGKPRDIIKIDKPYKSVYLQGNLVGSGLYEATYLKYYGLFTFCFSQYAADGSQVIVFSNWEKGVPYVGVATIRPGADPEVRSIPLPRNTRSYSNDDDNLSGACKGRPGQILVFYYDKKEKAIVMWLDKF